MTAQIIDRMLHILVIDDEEAILNTVHMYLELAGYRISTMNSAEDAWQLVGTDEPDTILTEVMMPGEDGWKLINNKRRGARNSRWNHRGWRVGNRFYFFLSA